MPACGEAWYLGRVRRVLVVKRKAMDRAVQMARQNRVAVHMTASRHHEGFRVVQRRRFVVFQVAHTHLDGFFFE